MARLAHPTDSVPSLAGRRSYATLSCPRRFWISSQFWRGVKRLGRLSNRCTWFCTNANPGLASMRFY